MSFLRSYQTSVHVTRFTFCVGLPVSTLGHTGPHCYAFPRKLKQLKLL